MAGSMRHGPWLGVLVALWAGAAGADLLDAKQKKQRDLPSAHISQLWNEPVDLETRDLFLGPGGRESVPRSGATYRFLEKDSSGHSSGYEVEDRQGRVWKIKIGEEAQAEIVVSRILWAIGYHQPPLHYVEEWGMTGGPPIRREPGRFRLESGYEKEGYWHWGDNPFVGTRQLKGLIVANTLLNNWDLTPTNTRIYRVERRSGRDAIWYVNQDVGGSLGKTFWPIGSRNNLEDFESQGFVEEVRNGRVKFDYHARHGKLLRQITPRDVVWTCRLMARLSDRQLRDAFRAAHYPEWVSRRYIRKIKEKIQEGLALEREIGASR